MSLEKIVFTYEKIQGYVGLTDLEKLLVSKAMESSRNAYAPYSKFHVGSAVMLDDQTIITGNNQENIAYPSGLCAERVALFWASSQYPNQKINTIAIAAYSLNFEVINPVTPCGSCRQVMVEYETKQESPITILLVGKNHIYKIAEASYLLPLVFHEVGLKSSK